MVCDGLLETHNPDYRIFPDNIIFEAAVYRVCGVALRFLSSTVKKIQFIFFRNTFSVLVQCVTAHWKCSKKKHLSHCLLILLLMCIGNAHTPSLTLIVRHAFLCCYGDTVVVFCEVCFNSACLFQQTKLRKREGRHWLLMSPLWWVLAVRTT